MLLNNGQNANNIYEVWINGTTDQQFYAIVL